MTVFFVLAKFASNLSEKRACQNRRTFIVQMGGEREKKKHGKHFVYKETTDGSHAVEKSVR